MIQTVRTKHRMQGRISLETGGCTFFVLLQKGGTDYEKNMEQSIKAG